MDQIKISDGEAQKILQANEGHFLDLKSVNITPAKLTKTIAAFSNAEGGELFIGIEDNPRVWQGFANQEDANGHIQTFEIFSHLVLDMNITFWKMRTSRD